MDFIKFLRVLLVGVFISGLSPNGYSQCLIIVNNSKCTVFFQVFSSEKNESAKKYSSVTQSINAASSLKYYSLTDIQWLEKVPKPGVRFTALTGMYIDPSGACTSYASNDIGDSRYKFINEAVLNTAKCGGAYGDLKLTWSANEKNVIVTIN